MQLCTERKTQSVALCIAASQKTGTCPNGTSQENGITQCGKEWQELPCDSCLPWNAQNHYLQHQKKALFQDQAGTSKSFFMLSVSPMHIQIQCKRFFFFLIPNKRKALLHLPVPVWKLGARQQLGLPLQRNRHFQTTTHITPRKGF